MKKKIFFRWLKVVLLFYGIIGIAFFYLQEKMIFHPVVLHPDDLYTFSKPYEEVNITVSDKSNIHIVKFPSQKDSSRGVVLFFHGNSENINRYAKYAPIFTSKGYDVWMLEYPGYGKSRGAMNESNFYEWALQTYKLARTKYQPTQIILYGKSLGTGIATQLASKRDCKKLILESPYYELPSLFRPYLFLFPLNRLMHHHFPTYEYIQKVDAPITILHGTEDGLISLKNSEKLSRFFKKGDQLIPVKGGSHNDLLNFPEFREAIAKEIN